MLKGGMARDSNIRPQIAIMDLACEMRPFVSLAVSLTRRRFAN